VWVSPLFRMNGGCHYPPVHLSPGEERRVRGGDELGAQQTAASSGARPKPASSPGRIGEAAG
jgi:hypothetical protein